ncbi:MAG TPA: hypothetical protein VK253_07185 [Candidatus Binatia bacterium]|nr:hypothetical protein [Candidatus Binatia bacterium]
MPTRKGMLSPRNCDSTPRDVFSKKAQTLHFETIFSVTLRNLRQYKKIAIRQGTWFRVLNRIERGIIDLTAKYVGTIRSENLAKIVTAIIEKLQHATETIADKLLRTVGLPLARKNSNIAVSWGNLSASKWAEDCTYARYLTLNANKGVTADS